MSAALLDRTSAELESAGMRWLVVRVLEDNHRARTFYERRGLRLDGHRSFDRIGRARLAVLRYARTLSPMVDFRTLLR